MNDLTTIILLFSNSSYSLVDSSNVMQLFCIFNYGYLINKVKYRNICAIRNIGLQCVWLNDFGNWSQQSIHNINLKNRNDLSKSKYNQQ